MIQESILLWNLTDLIESFDGLEAALKVLNTTLHTLLVEPIDFDDFLDLIQLLEAKIRGMEVNDPLLDPILNKLVTRGHNLNYFPDLFPEELEILDLSGNGLHRRLYFSNLNHSSVQFVDLQSFNL